jgi:CDP-diacylglycerol---glycerol-3-phosphate 3-phosphatidyltransferase
MTQANAMTISPPGSDREGADRSYVDARLRGTVWERQPVARWVYAQGLAFAASLSRAGVTANALTYTSLALAAVAALLCALSLFGYATVAILLSGGCDALDGAVARASGMTSRYGALLDSAVDRLSDALPLLGLVVGLADRPWLSVLPAVALLGSIAIPYIRARVEALGGTLPPLFMRRPERVVLLVLSLALGEIGFASIEAPLLLVGLAALALLSAVGTLAALGAARVALAGIKSPGASASIACDESTGGVFRGEGTLALRLHRATPWHASQRH